jgi:hypothetical protein
MTPRFLAPLALVGALAILTGCPGGTSPSQVLGPGTPGGGTSTSPSPGTSASPSASPSTTTPPVEGTAPKTPKDGAASQSYVLTKQELGKRGYKTWQLFRMEGKSLSAAGVVDANNQSWVVYVKTPSDNKYWRATLVSGGENTLEEVTSAEDAFKLEALDLSKWNIDSREAVTKAGASTTGSMFLYSAKEFASRSGMASTNPGWIINISGGQAFVDANTGTKIK